MKKTDCYSGITKAKKISLLRRHKLFIDGSKCEVYPNLNCKNIKDWCPEGRLLSMQKNGALCCKIIPQSRAQLIKRGKELMKSVQTKLEESGKEMTDGDREKIKKVDIDIVLSLLSIMDSKDRRFFIKKY